MSSQQPAIGVRSRAVRPVPAAKSLAAFTLSAAVAGGALLFNATPAAASDPVFTDEQIAVGTDVYEVGTTVGASDRAMLAAFEAGLVESEMQANPQPCEGDHDSAGAFQQRRDWVPADEAPPEDGWCVEGEDPRLVPEWAATAFFNGTDGHYGAIYWDGQDEDQWGDPIVTAGDVAQATQVSAYPDRYDEREQDAQALMLIVSDGDINPYTAEEVCGDGYVQIDEAELGAKGTVVLMWDASKGKNCVVTLKAKRLGEASRTSAYLQPKGRDRTTDKGKFQFYAGPVSAKAPGCIRWGGSVGNKKYDSPLEHCSS